MNADDCNGRPYVPGSGGESATQWNLYDGGTWAWSAPNSQPSSPNPSFNADTIKVELYSDEKPGAPHPERREGAREEGWSDDRGVFVEEGSADRGGGTSSGLDSPTPVSGGPIRLPNGKLQCDVCGIVCLGPNVLMVHKRTHTGERPFQCDTCGASFTQKGNLLRHTKLHSGEKPFKCSHCNYACRRRDALLGHLRTHAGATPTVGKPYKCKYCIRSYKQQSSLEEHHERCHHYLPRPDHMTAQGEESKSLDAATESTLETSNEKLPFIERTANSGTKRKRSKPQRFLGEKRVLLNMPEAAYDFSAGSEKHGSECSLHPGGESTGWKAMVARYLLESGGSGEDSKSPKLPLSQPSYPSELTLSRPVYRYTAPLGPQASDCGGVVSIPVGLAGREADEGHSHGPSPVEGCDDSTNTEGTAEEQSAGATVPTRRSNGHRRHHLTPASYHARAVAPTGGKRSPGSSPSSREVLRVVDGEGQVLHSYCCDHCRTIFLSHVMFTIHMGGHGYRQPLECNICGHLSLDAYEFSSHMVRGKHNL